MCANINTNPFKGAPRQRSRVASPCCLEQKAVSNHDGWPVSPLQQHARGWRAGMMDHKGSPQCHILAPWKAGKQRESPAHTYTIQVRHSLANWRALISSSSTPSFMCYLRIQGNGMGWNVLKVAFHWARNALHESSSWPVLNILMQQSMQRQTRTSRTSLMFIAPDEIIQPLLGMQNADENV